MTRVLIINGDDLGLTRAISDGIFQAHENGVLTSVSLMVNQSATEYAVRQLSKYPELGVGIHLNLSQGKPVLPRHAVPSLVGSSGEFLCPDEIRSRLMKWHVSRDEVQAEYRAQIRLARAMGVNPTHADSHHHMHLFFAAVMPFRRALEAEGVHSIRACRIRQWPPPRRIGGPHSGTMLRRLGVLAYMEFLSAGPLRPFRSPYCRIETRPGSVLSSVDAMVKAWDDVFQSLGMGGVFELVCHPGVDDPARSHTDRIHDKRISELALLTAPEFKQLLARSGIKLASYVGLNSSLAAPFAAQVEHDGSATPARHSDGGLALAACHSRLSRSPGQQEIRQ